MSEPRTATYFNLLPREQLEAEALQLEHTIARVREIPYAVFDCQLITEGRYGAFNEALAVVNRALDGQEES